MKQDMQVTWQVQLPVEEDHLSCVQRPSIESKHTQSNSSQTHHQVWMTCVTRNKVSSK